MFRLTALKLCHNMQVYIEKKVTIVVRLYYKVINSNTMLNPSFYFDLQVLSSSSTVSICSVLRDLIGDRDLWSLLLCPSV